VATKAAGTPAARFLLLPFSTHGQLVQQLNKGFINNLVAVAPSNLDVALNDTAIRQMALRPPPGIKGLATRVARAAHASPRAKPTRPPRSSSDGGQM
jgi:hypothetical protein